MTGVHMRALATTYDATTSTTWGAGSRASADVWAAVTACGRAGSPSATGTCMHAPLHSHTAAFGRRTPLLGRQADPARPSAALLRPSAAGSPAVFGLC